jgi:hypothetical protein
MYAYEEQKFEGVASVTAGRRPPEAGYQRGAHKYGGNHHKDDARGEYRYQFREVVFRAVVTDRQGVAHGA